MTIKRDISAVIPEEQDIYISGRIWDELYPKVDPAPFIYAMHRNIVLSNYGTGINRFYFTFIVTRPQNKRHQPGSYFNPKNREFEVAVRIPYEQVVDATYLECIHSMEQAFLEGIQKIAELELDAPFDYERLKEDVVAIFAQEKWYEFEELMA